MWTSMSTATTIAITISTLLWNFVSPAYGKPVAETNTNNIASNNNSLFLQDVMRISKVAEIRTYMNEEIDPCDDFYEFSCGNWAKINPANESIKTGIFEQMNEALNRKIKNMLKASAEPQDTEIDIKIKDFYMSCTQMQKLKEDKTTLYRNKLFEIIDEFGGMPAISGDKWDVDKFDWLETIAKIGRKYGKGIILDALILPDFVDNSVNRLCIGHAEMPLKSRSMYVDEETKVYRNNYKRNIANVLSEHLDFNENLANQTAHEIVDFETALAFRMLDEKEGKGLDQIAKSTAVADLQQKYKNAIDFVKLIRIRFDEKVQDPIYEMVPEFQNNIVNILEATPKSTVANYIMYTLLDSFFLRTAKTQEKQDEDCISITKKYFAKNLDNMIYRRYDTNRVVEDVNLIWKELKKTFKEELQSSKLQWISEEVRQSAIDKLNAMGLEINSYTKENFTKEFDKLIIVRDDYITNIKNILQDVSMKNIAKLHEEPRPFEDDDYSYSPVNSLLQNIVKVPLSMFQPNYLWAANYPNALKFGNLGALIGHEIIHGFDDRGRQFDKRGNQLNWWDDNSTDAFKNRTECFINQYNTYKYYNRFLPRSNLQAENIADNGGIRIAYESYLRWLENAIDLGEDMYLETLPSLNYTSKQLFFLSYAQVWCNDVHSTMRLLETAIDTHVPGKFRVIGALSNFPDFAKEFNCDKNTLMNRNRKCEIY